MIDSSYLLGLYGLSSSSVSTSSTSVAAKQKSQPTPPWDSKAVVPKADALVRSALGGRRIVDETAPALDLKSASSDYRKLFALYQGLETLNALANRAAVKGIGGPEQALLTKRFASGLAEVGDYLATAKLADVRLVQGVTASTSKSSAAVMRDSPVSHGTPVHEGSADDPVAAFQGPVTFGMTVKTTLATKTVAIDLDEMGSTPRTLGAVLSHINGKLEAAGIETRLGREHIKAEPKTVTVNGKPVTLPAGADRWALSVRGVSTEAVSFTATQTADAVFVTQSVGATGGQQLLKFQSDAGGSAPATTARVGETFWVDGRASQSTLPEGVETIRASATAADGSVWVVGDLSAGPGNQPIKGERDVALMKFDSAGRLVSTRALGAASTASGYALSIGADGRIAVAGSVTGALESGKTGEVATVADSFVTVFDDKGQELWTQRRGARAADEATSVAFASDGTVVVGGRAQSAMVGGTAVGGWDGYVQTFKASQLYPGAPYTVTASSARQFGTTGEDSVQAMTVEGSDVYTAGVEDGRMMVRRFNLNTDGSTTLTATRDLGNASGEVAGLSVSGGKVILTGETRNSALDIGTVNTAHAGGVDAFVASLGTDLTASADDRLTYFGGTGDDSAADVKVHNGKVWLTGIANRPEDAEDDDPTQAYLARLDSLSGAVEWTRTWSGAGEQAKPGTLSIVADGASVLDRLGLPKGEIVQTDSKLLTDATAVRAGDRFFVSPANGGRSVAVTIDARDTLQTLARKIEQASNMKLKVTVNSESAALAEGTQGQTALEAGLQRLSITARDGKVGAVISAGDPGRDALAGLGLSPGFVGLSTGDGATRTFGLNLSKTLNLSSADSIKTAGENLQNAMKAVRDAYRALAPQTKSAAATGTAPAYLTAQLANYQAALARLGG